jgi:DNA-binding MarR family transcriptional regulator
MPQQIKDDRNANVEWLAQVFSSSVRSHCPDLNLRQLAVLLIAQNAKVPLGVKELSALLQIPKSAVTRAIHRLQSAHLVTRRPTLEDRRRVSVHLLPRGNEYMRHIEGWVLDQVPKRMARDPGLEDLPHDAGFDCRPACVIPGPITSPPKRSTTRI